MRRVVGTLGLLFAVVLSAGSCGGGGGGNQPVAPEKTENAAAPTTEAAASAGSLPASGPVPVGEYRTEVFEPTVSFKVDEAFGGDEGWLVPGPELPDSVGLFGQGETALFFSNVQKVFDPSELPEEVLVPAPKDMVAWLREHPYLEAGEPTQANVGGVSATQLDVIVPVEPKDYSYECATPCVPGWDLSKEPDAYHFLPGYKDRLFVLDVEGETVIVAIEAPEETFEGFLPKAQEVLDTVKWEPGP